MANKWLGDQNPDDVELILVGKKGNDFYKRRPWNIVETFMDWSGNLDYAKARNLVDMLTKRFLDGETDEISVIYTQFLSTARYKIVDVPYLPVENLEEVQGEEDQQKSNLDYIFEPSPEAIFTDIMPKYALTKMITALADSFASEHGTRMMAMGSATQNAGEMIDALTLQYNKARQAAITKELLEIVSGAEALKG